ncbi:hypothetical protein Vadar_014840 [Vaccinium darrowii]|uniref:Uncharacterized protein n=1 Tax=Vaccinium darrowii TaxID=229202 RepID=A0ACB7Z4J2_9ERIC|nr:hypothetical protein Vadar_014840 [Vaccinium darrowii]
MAAGGGDSDPFSFERTRSYTLPSPTPFILSSYPFFLPSSSGFVFSGGPRSALERWPHVYGSWRPWVSRQHPPTNGEAMERLEVRRLEEAMEDLKDIEELYYKKNSATLDHAVVKETSGITRPSSLL